MTQAIADISRRRQLADQPTLHVAREHVVSIWGDRLTARGIYVERYWLPVVGPTPLCLYRLLAQVETESRLSMPMLGDLVGCGFSGGATSALVRSLDRLVNFHLCDYRANTLFVSDRAPMLTPGQLARLHPVLRATHKGEVDSWRL